MGHKMKEDDAIGFKTLFFTAGIKIKIYFSCTLNLKSFNCHLCYQTINDLSLHYRQFKFAYDRLSDFFTSSKEITSSSSLINQLLRKKQSITCSEQSRFPLASTQNNRGTKYCVGTVRHYVRTFFLGPLGIYQKDEQSNQSELINMQ